MTTAWLVVQHELGVVHAEQIGSEENMTDLNIYQSIEKLVSLS